MSHQSPITSHESRITSHESRATDLRSALRRGIAQLEREQVPSAALAAELLLMHTLGRDRTWIYAHPEHQLEAAQREQYFEMVARRASGVPTQYLTGHQEFWALDFEVTPDVLIPRPETEHVIEVALDCLAAQARTDSIGACATQQFRIADVGTGSGCIAVALAHELPAAQIVATDISAAALTVARRNADVHGVAERIAFIQSNLLDSLLHGSRTAGRESRLFDLIASNPPYIARGESGTLPREVREHEPQSALFGGETGVEIYAPLIKQAAKVLKPGGFLVLELGYDSAEHVSRLLDSPEWTGVAITNDLAGIPRVASAERACN